MLGSVRYPVTPDGRYFVAKNRLWRCTDPNLSEDWRESLMSDLGKARALVKNTRGDTDGLAAARRKVHTAKIGLGERGPVWWTDGALDQTGKAPNNSTYSDWWAAHDNTKSITIAN
ncbi:hypothetical protein N9D37_01035 [Erythrobacter sp.]|nr:hypothetical protein [Erythrobacter sp.]